MPQVSQDFLAKLPIRPIDWLLYTNLCASTVLQRAGAVLWSARAVFIHTHRRGVCTPRAHKHLCNVNSPFIINVYERL